MFNWCVERMERAGWHRIHNRYSSYDHALTVARMLAYHYDTQVRLIDPKGNIVHVD